MVLISYQIHKLGPCQVYKSHSINGWGWNLVIYQGRTWHWYHNITYVLAFRVTKGEYWNLNLRYYQSIQPIQNVYKNELILYGFIIETCHKVIGSQVFMWHGWELCLYAIIPSLDLRPIRSSASKKDRQRSVAGKITLSRAMFRLWVCPLRPTPMSPTNVANSMDIRSFMGCDSKLI